MKTENTEAVKYRALELLALGIHGYRKTGFRKKHSLEYRVVVLGIWNPGNIRFFLEHMVLGIETENLWFWRYTVLII